MDSLRRLYLRLRYDAFLTFLLGAITAGMIQILSGDLWNLYGVTGILLALLFVAIGFLVYRLILWLFQKLLPPEQYPIGKPPQQRRGLIMVLGGGSRQTGPAAMEYHHSRLEHVWFVTTDFTEPIADDLKRSIYPVLTHPESVVNQWEPPECQNAVERALSHARILGIEPEEMICDVTGGTTAMTVGAVQACLAHNLAAQMVTARYDDTRKAVVPIGVIALDLHSDHGRTSPQATPPSIVA